MADNFPASPATSGGNTFASDDILGVHYPRGKVVWGADGSATDASMAAPLPIQPGTGITFAVTDNAGSLTVDNNGTFAVQAAQSGTWNVGTVTAITNTVTTDQANAAEADYDTGAGTVTQVMFGLALPGSGGPVAGGTSTAPVRVDPTGGTTQPVSGTVTANAGTGTFAVSGTVTANAGAGTFTVGDGGATLSVDDGGGSLTVDGSVSVSGAVDTELTTADLDTGAGTDTRAVVGLVYGAAGGGVLVSTANPLPVGDNGGSLTVDGTVAVSGTVAVDSELPAAAALADNAANPTAPAVGSFLMGFDGAAWDRVRADGGSLFVQDGGNSLTVDNAGTFAVQAAQGGTWTVQPGNTANTTAWLVTGTGGTFPATQSGTWNVGTVTAVTDITNWGNVVDNAGFTDGTTRVLMAGYVYDEVAGTALTENDAAAARINANRATVGVIEDGATRARYATVTAANALKVDGSAAAQPVTDNAGSLTVDVPAVATGGATPGKLISAATTNATSVKASAGTLYSLQAFNTNAAARYLKLYNKASAPAVGTDVPVQVFTVPGNTAGAGLVVPIPTCGIEFPLGIALATTTGAADSDTGAVAANEIVVSYGYK